MATNRELLEAAAKAAGYKICYWLNNDGWAYVSDSRINRRFEWSSFEDDGDAFRLLVAKLFTIKYFPPHDAHEIVQVPPNGTQFGCIEIWREDDEDPLHVECYNAGCDSAAATRRAITRAAAATQGVK